ncbi:hypothetical protein PoMZ_13426 [Pyricularia oryzae]|uniref:Uncharacterized protein n=1 Tax=Pyricularia oryzae TaxID=318829 RepID=A0A4P7NVG2_PYROR|nr:hypothetical protein PoMZ_13426 [Pyricularia oryzae]
MKPALPFLSAELVVIPKPHRPQVLPQKIRTAALATISDLVLSLQCSPQDIAPPLSPCEE